MCVCVCSSEIRGTSLSNSHITHSLFCRSFLSFHLSFFFLFSCFSISTDHFFLRPWLIHSSTVGAPHTHANTHTPLASFTEVFTAVVSEWSDLKTQKQKEQQKCLSVCHTHVRLNVSFRPAVQTNTTWIRLYYLGDICTLQHQRQSGGLWSPNAFIEAQTFFWSLCPHHNLFMSVCFQMIQI